MLTEEKILENKEVFISLVKSINREGMNTGLLIKQLEQSDFFEAPASTKYHGAYKGGLCEHSLNVYANMTKISNADMDSIKIVSLFHDLSLMNFYIQEVKNRKVYSELGNKEDSMGRYTWESYMSYSIKDPKDRMCIGNHEAISAYMANYFIPLSVEEYASIASHHAGTNYDSVPENWMVVFGKYPLAAELHAADILDTFNPEVRCND